MTNQTKYNQLREEIILANSDIVELKFGCKIKTVFGELVEIVKNERMPDGELMTNSSNNNYQYIHIDEILEIIGRDITNDDIQIAISKNLKNGSVLNCHINARGEVVLRIDDKLIDLKLGKPLQDQSQSTIDFLFDLICKE